jgi:hypothetical protein
MRINISILGGQNLSEIVSPLKVCVGFFLDTGENPECFLVLASRFQAIAICQSDLPEKIVALRDEVIRAQLFSGYERTLQFRLRLSVLFFLMNAFER